jgi:hypothetical protein
MLLMTFKLLCSTQAGHFVAVAAGIPFGIPETINLPHLAQI